MIIAATVVMGGGRSAISSDLLCRKRKIDPAIATRAIPLRIRRCSDEISKNEKLNMARVNLREIPLFKKEYGAVKGYLLLMTMFTSFGARAIIFTMLSP